MQLSPLTKLIESADFLEFREIAFGYLKLKGYHDVELRDGGNDGGSDFAVGTLGSNPTPLAIQVTVQRTGWQAKVKADFRQAKADLNLTYGLYLTSRRLPAAEFTKVAEELWDQDAITVRAVDCQSIASAFFENGDAGYVLRALGISLTERRPDAVPRPSLKEDAAYSFTFFGEASEQFRQSVVEQTVLSYLTRTGDEQSRAATESAVANALQLSEDQAGLVSSAVDRMLQRQQLKLSDSQLTVDGSVVDRFKVMRALRESQWRHLAGNVDGYLGEAGLRGAALERASATIMTGAGALFMAAASSAGAAVGMEDPGPIRQQLRKRTKEIGAAMVAAGVPEAELDGRLLDLARLVSNSDIGVVLMAGELFVSLVSLETNHLERAFGAPGGSEIYLDASVAIPMITGLLYEQAHQRFSMAALRIHELAERRGIPLKLPRAYLEEAASHLLEAVELYQPLLGKDDDLRYSGNAFVAHFSDLTSRKVLDCTFTHYAKGLGYAERITTAERQRDAVMDELALRFANYGIEIFDLPDLAKTQALTYAQEAVTFTAQELHLKRTGIVLRHDAAVIAYFMDSDFETHVARILCTWDKLHLRLETHEGHARWQALDPPTLGDLLILTRPDGTGELTTTVNLAMELGDEDSERGAAVLDALVRIEGSGLHDAEALSLAKQFKDAWIRTFRDSNTPEDLADAWAEWKGGSRELSRQSKL